jgi:hypothetical protein
MTRRARHLAIALAVAITAGLLSVALPASAAAGDGAGACKVYNTSQGFGRDSLQKAVWAADAGDSLMWRGTCEGTTLVSKNVDVLSFRISAMECDRRHDCRVSGDPGMPSLRSGTWRPTIVVDPRVTDLEIVPRGKIHHGVVIDQVANWKRRTRVAPIAWRSHPRSAKGPSALDPARGRRACLILNLVSGARFEHMQRAVEAASAGDSLTFQGKCTEPIVIDRSLHIQGHRSPLPRGAGCAVRGCSASRGTTGTPMLGSVTVVAGVDDVALKHLTINGRFAVRQATPAD